MEKDKMKWHVIEGLLRAVAHRLVPLILGGVVTLLADGGLLDAELARTVAELVR